MNCHRHHHHHSDPHRKRQQNLAWFGIVMVVTILAFLGMAILADQNNHSSVPANPPPVAQDNPPVDEPSTPVVTPPTVDESPGVRHRPHHRHRHWNHDRRSHVLCGGGNDSGYGDQWMSGYDHCGEVVAVPNPDYH